MKNPITLPTIVAGTTLLGALSYFLLSPKKPKAKKTKKLVASASEDTSECFI